MKSEDLKLINLTKLNSNIQDLKNCKDEYFKKIEMYNDNFTYMKNLLEEEKNEDNKKVLQALIKKVRDIIDEFNNQVSKIELNLINLGSLVENYDIFTEVDFDIQAIECNNEYDQIKEVFATNMLLYDGKVKLEYVTDLNDELSIEEKNKVEKIKTDEDNEIKIEELNEEDDLKNNDTLLISEILGKVILPYTKFEVRRILYNKKNNYSNEEEVIEKCFTRNLSDYKFQAWSRYNETIKLATEREEYKKFESIGLAIEMMKKKYLHPAIISACKSLNELDVYLDCLDKNELDDFKIFKIKYELYPTKVSKKQNNSIEDDVNEKSLLKIIVDMFKNFYSKNTKKGKRYI